MLSHHVALSSLANPFIPIHSSVSIIRRINKLIVSVFTCYWLCIFPIYLLLPGYRNDEGFIEKYLRDSNRAFLLAQQEPPSISQVAIATRIHLQNASVPPLKGDLERTIQPFLDFVSSVEVQRAYIAVDGAPKFSGHDLVGMIKELTQDSNIEVITVVPWYQNIPALNAILEQAAQHGASYLLFASAETTTSRGLVNVMLQHMTSQTLVTGAVFPGHDYHAKSRQPLNGRTSPWNTLAMWNVDKLALTGFPMVAEGVHRDEVDGKPIAAGVEEVSAIALLQKMLGAESAKAKLLPLQDVQWRRDFDEDDERRRYHEQKMQSKVERPAKHLKLLGLEGYVEHL
jgi:hypothetical protein